jgi:hypothetical protein
VAEALGGTAEGSYAHEQEAAAVEVEEDEEMDREDEQGVAKRPDLNELDVPEWDRTGIWHWIKQNRGSCSSACPLGVDTAALCCKTHMFKPCKTGYG